MSKRRIIISVTNKTGIEKFRRLTDLGWEIISTGGTATTLANAGLPVTQVQVVTKFPEMMGGRVKTLHPNVFAGILFVRGNADHEAALAKFGIAPIDVVVVNLYDFAGKPDIEQIDIGGPSLLRAAAKNGIATIPVIDPADYDATIDALAATGDISQDERERLVIKVFEHTGKYDQMISSWMIEQRKAGRRFLTPAAPSTH